MVILILLVPLAMMLYKETRDKQVTIKKQSAQSQHRAVLCPPPLPPKAVSFDEPGHCICSTPTKVTKVGPPMMHLLSPGTHSRVFTLGNHLEHLPSSSSTYLLRIYWVGQKVCLNFSVTSYRKTWISFFGQPNISAARKACFLIQS